MPEHVFTFHVPQPLWEVITKLVKAQNCTASQVAQDALEFYLAELMPKLPLSPEEAKNSLSGIKDSLAAEVIKEREEGW
jgi:hypothetical protein